jgi:CRP-like cAMP-binding protein
LAKHADTFVAQCLQTAACNATHALRQRLARWLLTMADRSGEDVLPLTQGFLGEILAVRRSSVTLVARVMQGAGLIDYSRGVITIRNRVGLKAMACECYEIIRQTYDEAFAADIERE